MEKIKPTAAVGDKPRQKSHTPQSHKKEEKNFDEIFKKVLTNKVSL